jgi:hypothetical protein
MGLPGTGVGNGTVSVRVVQQDLVVPGRGLQVEINGEGPAGRSVTAAPPAEAGGTDGLA